MFADDAQLGKQDRTQGRPHGRLIQVLALEGSRSRATLDAAMRLSN